jgi:hypothetical protein
MKMNHSYYYLHINQNNYQHYIFYYVFTNTIYYYFIIFPLIPYLNKNYIEKYFLL